MSPAILHHVPVQLTEPSFTARLDEPAAGAAVWTAPVVRVIDHDNGHQSVTNAAERVVELILEEIPVVGSLRLPIVYRDSMGIWDQLHHDGRRFTGFGPLRAGTESEAIRLVLRRNSPSIEKRDTD